MGSQLSTNDGSSELTMRTRILDATLEAITRIGIDHFSIADVSRLAKISRQSIYRHFSGKPDLLISLTQHLQSKVEKNMEAVLGESGDLETKLLAISRFENGKDATDLLKSEPKHMLNFLADRDRNSRLKKIIQSELNPFFEDAERRSGITIDRVLIVELLERIKISLFLVPAGARQDFGDRVIKAIVMSALQHPETWRADDAVPATAVFSGE